jgi:type II secretory pathway pseudopilin PulG
MRRNHAHSDCGYAMAALLVAMSIMGIMLGLALPAWRTVVQREREAELIFRGEQYAQAVALFNRRTGGFPTSLVALREGRYIRQLYKDPITGGDFQPVYLGQVAPLTPPSVPGRGGSGAPTTGAPSFTGRGQLQAQPATQPMGRFGQPGPTGVQAGSPFGATQPGRGGPPTPGTLGQPGATGAGPIIGVVSRSTGEAMRLYNGRGRYNEWLFVSTAATQQPGPPPGAPTPGMPGVGPGGRGPGGRPGGPGRGARGRGDAPGIAPFDRPTAPGRGPGGFQPSPFGPPGRPGGPSGAPSPFTPGRGRL